MAAPPFKVKAIYAYDSPHEDDLSFPEGQVITVTEEEDADWYVGAYTDAQGAAQTGLFPKNFVEKFEPQAPPRPTRARPKAAEPPSPAPAAASIAEPDVEPPVTRQAEPQAPVPAPAPAPKPAPADPGPPPAPKPVQVVPAAKQPPPVSQKPSSFKDRIAAFNQPAAAPIAPFKPPGQASQSFIKKPFVAPPPSRNSYVPPTQPKPEAHKIYRREEDPEIAEQQAEAEQAAERAGFSVSGAPAGGEEGAEDEDAPRQMSLKDRIAALQKQQAEQAQRRADAGPKEKPKKPPKKRIESHDTAEDGGGLERELSGEQTERPSTDAPARKASRGSEMQEPFSDGGNDADLSAAGETTEDAGASSTSVEEEAVAAPRRQPEAPVQEEEDEEGEEEEEEEELDEETRRQIALRERMAKLSGGMGMVGMFGPGGGMPQPGQSAPVRKKKPAPPPGAQSSDSTEYSSQPTALPGMGMVPIPGMGKPPSVQHRENDDAADVEEVPKPPTRRSTDRPAPPVPSDRPVPEPQVPERGAPPPVPGDRPGRASLESRPAPPPPPVSAKSPTEGSESDDEMQDPSMEDLPIRPKGAGGPPPPARPAEPRSPPLSPPGRTVPVPMPTSPRTSTSERGPPPPVPSQNRGPPPPPPGVPSRQATGDLAARRPADGEEGESDYEGDYDTDIASSAKHKAALSHTRGDSIDDTTADEASLHQKSPQMPHAAPPVPSTSRAAPPPPPHHETGASSSFDGKRNSIGGRGGPPPVPAARQTSDMADDEYDPYRYTGLVPVSPSAAKSVPATQPAAPSSGAPQLPPISPVSGDDEEELYAPPKRSSTDRRPPPPGPPPAPYERAAPPPPAQQPGVQSPILPISPAPPPRRSTDQALAAPSRRSTDLPRASHDGGFIAQDLDLGRSTQWWTQQNVPPPALQSRRDVLFEIEENTSNKSGAVSKTVYVLYQDYSQTIITAQSSAQSPESAKLEQRHEPPPGKLRQDQLEDAHTRFGARLSGLVTKAEGSVIGDGSPQAVVLELLAQLQGALFPVGTRSYGALVYQNIGNATVQQFDEIRPGDVVSFRNAKFSGKHGTMHTKYSQDVGKPDHVAIVAEWDGTKKKVRGWEQGRDNEGGPDEDGPKAKGKSKGGKIKVKAQSFRLDDLRSGEVRVWRVMPRSWVGWEDSGS